MLDGGGRGGGSEVQRGAAAPSGSVWYTEGMGVVIPTGFGQANIPFRLSGDAEEMVVTFGFDDDLSFSPAGVAAGIRNALDTLPHFVAADIAVGYEWGPVRVTCMRSLGPVEGVDTQTVVGANAGILPLPSNCAALVQKRTARGGRAGRGRMFWPLFWVNESSVSPTGFITDPPFASWAASMNSFLANLASSNLEMHLLHSEPEVGPPLPPDPVLSLTAVQTIATQRTRLRK